jgi:hypothetical protein
MNDHQKLSAPLRGAEHYNQIEPSPNVRKTLDTTDGLDQSLTEETQSSVLLQA